MTETSHDALVGQQVLGRYQIVRLLARGGMGAIYLARSVGAAGFVKPVIVKRILPTLTGDDSVVRMFAREARILAKLNHPGVVAVLDFGREGNDYIMAMEYVQGQNLLRWARYIQQIRGSFPIEHVVHIATHVLDALHYAHTLSDSDGFPLSIVHRDVTPSNVLIDLQGNVKLVDFGIARSSNDATEASTEGNPLKGKFAYIAPELFGAGAPGPPTDVYSVAVLLHEVLTGRNEMSGANMEETINNALKKDFSRLDATRPEVSKALADVVAQGLKKDPKQRYASAKEFAAALRGVRTKTAEEALEALARDAGEDFNDKRMVSLFQGSDLAALERAWRTSIPNREEPPAPMDATMLAPEQGATARARGPAVGGPDHGGNTGNTGNNANGTNMAGLAGGTAHFPSPTQRLRALRESMIPGARVTTIVWAAVAGVAILATATVAVTVVLVRSRDSQHAPAQYVYVEGVGDPGSSPRGAAGGPNEPGNGPNGSANGNGTEDPSGPSGAQAQGAILNLAPTQDGGATGTRGTSPTSARSASGNAGNGARGDDGGALRGSPTGGAGTGSSDGDPLEAITRIFSRQSSRFTQCGVSHQQDIPTGGSVTISLTIDPGGHVTEAHLLQAALGSTGFGQCVLGIARGTQFGPQTAGVSVRLPISVHRVGP